MKFLISSAVSIGLAAFFFLFGCSTVQIADTKAILATCATAVAEAEAAKVYETLLAIVEHQPINWQNQIIAQEAIGKQGVICALQQIANGQPGPVPTIKLQPAIGGSASMIFGMPSAKAMNNARAFLVTHK